MQEVKSWPPTFGCFQPCVPCFLSPGCSSGTHHTPDSGKGVWSSQWASPGALCGAVLWLWPEMIQRCWRRSSSDNTSGQMNFLINSCSCGLLVWLHQQLLKAPDKDGPACSGTPKFLWCQICLLIDGPQPACQCPFVWCFLAVSSCCGEVMVLGELCGSSGNREQLCPHITPKVYVKNGEL